MSDPLKAESLDASALACAVVDQQRQYVLILSILIHINPTFVRMANDDLRARHGELVDRLMEAMNYPPEVMAQLRAMFIEACDKSADGVEKALEDGRCM